MTALDTNILIYACDRAFPDKQGTALRLISELADGVLLWQVACEFIAASRKLERHGFAPQHAWARLADFLRLFPLILPTPRVLDRAQEMHLLGGWSYWDAMVVAACLESGVRRLYSEDLPGRRTESLEILNPFV